MSGCKITVHCDGSASIDANDLFKAEEDKASLRGLSAVAQKQIANRRIKTAKRGEDEMSDHTYLMSEYLVPRDEWKYRLDVVYQRDIDKQELAALSAELKAAQEDNRKNMELWGADAKDKDVEIARQAQQIAELQKDKALIDGIMSDMRIVAGIGGCDIGGMTRDALNAKGSAPSNDEHAWRDEWRVQFRKAAYAAMLQTAKEQEGVDG